METPDKTRYICLFDEIICLINAMKIRGSIDIDLNVYLVYYYELTRNFQINNWKRIENSVHIKIEFQPESCFFFRLEIVNESGKFQTFFKENYVMN